MNQLEPDHQDLRTRAARILHAMADTPIPAMDATYYAHYAEELRMIVEELLAQPHPVNASVTRVWLLWNCHDIAGSYSTEHAAVEARATTLIGATGVFVDLRSAVRAMLGDRDGALTWRRLVQVRLLVWVNWLVEPDHLAGNSAGSRTGAAESGGDASLTRPRPDHRRMSN